MTYPAIKSRSTIVVGGVTAFSCAKVVTGRTRSTTAGWVIFATVRTALSGEERAFGDFGDLGQGRDGGYGSEEESDDWRGETHLGRFEALESWRRNKIIFGVVWIAVIWFACFAWVEKMIWSDDGEHERGSGEAFM
jgi:hypothetical protein